ncbi:MAG: FAD-dependent oxidoreductase [bacterium]
MMEKLGVNLEDLYDVIIVGGGPAGLSAGIYMARAKYKVLVLEKEKFGGQITITSEVVNYPGVFKTSGEALTKNMKEQAESFGCEFKIAQVLDIEVEDNVKTIKTNNGEFKTLGVILALGANPRKLGFEGEAKYQGRGVAYCATCDGEFFKDMTVYVVGGGFAAVEEGIFLTKYASEVKMIVREEDFTCAKTVSDHVYHNDKISVVFNTEVKSVVGDDFLREITLVNNITKEEVTHKYEDSFGVFVFAGYEPNTKWLPECIEKQNGYIVTDMNAKTNIDGVYAGGDVCIKNLRQVVTAVSDGATAATSLEKHVEALHQQLDIPELERNVKPKEIKSEESSVNNSSSEESSQEDGEFISADIRNQLQPLFGKFESKVIVKAFINKDKLGEELSGFIDECKTLNSKIVCEKISSNLEDEASYIELFYENEKSSGIKFQAIPGGHEFNSFIIALYNVAGAGKELPVETLEKIESLNSSNKEVDFKVVISLSCTMCPEVVTATQQLASKCENISATMIDLNYSPDLKEKHKIMSVPCMIVNDQDVYFGKKNIDDILELIK